MNHLFSHQSTLYLFKLLKLTQTQSHTHKHIHTHALRICNTYCESTILFRYTYSVSSVPFYFRLFCTSTVCSVYRVTSVIMCSSAMVRPLSGGNCSVVWDAVLLKYTCTEGTVSVTVCSVYHVTSVTMCSSAMIRPSSGGNCSAVCMRCYFCTRALRAQYQSQCVLCTV